MLQVNFAGAHRVRQEAAVLLRQPVRVAHPVHDHRRRDGPARGLGRRRQLRGERRRLPPALHAAAAAVPEPGRISVSIINTDYARIRCRGLLRGHQQHRAVRRARRAVLRVQRVQREGPHRASTRCSSSRRSSSSSRSRRRSRSRPSASASSASACSSRSKGRAPWRAHGTGSISLLFFEISADFDITWGEPSDTVARTDRRAAAARRRAREGPVVDGAAARPARTCSSRLRELTAPATPTCSCCIRWARCTCGSAPCPLDLTIAKVGNKRARDANRFALERDRRRPGEAGRPRRAVRAGAVPDDGRRGQAVAAGVRAAARRRRSCRRAPMAGTTARMTKRIVRYEEVVIDNRFRRQLFRFQAISGLLFDHFLNGAAHHRVRRCRAKAKQLKDPHASDNRGHRRHIRGGARAPTTRRSPAPPISPARPRRWITCGSSSPPTRTWPRPARDSQRRAARGGVMSSAIGTYSFLPWLRRGIANTITAADGAPRHGARATVPVDAAHHRRTGSAAAPATQDVHRDVAAATGPATSSASTRRAIVRTEPRPWITDFEPNYLPFVEFYDEDCRGATRRRAATPATSACAHGSRWWCWPRVSSTNGRRGARQAAALRRPSSDLGRCSRRPTQLWAWAHVHVNRDARRVARRDHVRRRGRGARRASRPCSARTRISPARGCCARAA